MGVCANEPGMIESSELLRSYAEGIRRLSGAGSVSLFVPPSLSGFSLSMLLHDGPLPPVAELADLETAQSFADRAHPETASEMIDSETPGGGLVPLPAVHSAWAIAVLPEQLVAGAPSPGRRRSDAGSEESQQPSAWLGLRFEGEQGSVLDHLGSGAGCLRCGRFGSVVLLPLHPHQVGDEEQSHKQNRTKVCHQVRVLACRCPAMVINVCQ